MKTAEELFKITLKAGLAPIPRVSVSNWADLYRQLPSDSAEPGRWRTSRTPYMREVMDSFTDPNIEKIVVKSAAQLGKSEVLLNVIGRYAHVDPSTIMIIQPTLEMAQDFSKARLTKMIADCKILTPLFYGEKTIGETRNANQTILSKFFTGGRLVLAGANSPAGLASRPIRILLVDEIDRFPPSAGAEGDPLSIAEKRTSTFFSRKIGIFSTPTVKGISRIDVEFERGTQEWWEHQCPNCREWYTADWKDITEVLMWRCPSCGFEFDELTVKNGPQRYGAPHNAIAQKHGIRSFFITGLYSPWVEWKTIRAEWLSAQGKPDLEKVVCNTRFGLSYEMRGDISDEKPFLQRLEQYDAEIPRGVLLLTAGVDVQNDRLEYEIVGWGEGEESWGICHGKIYGDPQTSEPWEGLDGVLERAYRSADASYNVARTFIDSGFRTAEVYRYCRSRLNRGCIPIKGYGQPGRALVYQTAMQGDLPIMILGVNEGKSMIYARLQLKEPGANYCHFGRDDRYMRRRYDEVYFKQMLSEHRTIRRSGGILYEAYETVTRHARNEALDMRVYALAAMKSFNITDWSQLKAGRVEKQSPRGVQRQHYREVDIW